jgi:hypothetical protein
METVTALVAAGAAFGLSHLIGRSLTASFLMVALGGVLAGVSFAVLFFVSTVTVGHFMPHMFEPWLLGVHFIGLMVMAPLGGATIAVLTHRHVERVDAARLPF